MPIQVKRRASDETTESVKVVRELFGVLFRDGFRDAAVVTTAKSFTRDAKREVDLVLKQGKCDRFELIDCDRFINLIGATADEIIPSWRSLLGKDENITERLLANNRYREFRRIVSEKPR